MVSFCNNKLFITVINDMLFFLLSDEEDDDYENGDSDGERKDDEIVKRFVLCF